MAIRRTAARMTALALAGATSSAATVTILDQTRAVEAHASADGAMMNDSGAAPDAGPYDDFAHAFVDGSFASADGYASQTSSLSAAGCSANGAASGQSLVDPTNPRMCSSSAASMFSVTFEVAQTCGFTLTGHVEAALTRPGGPSAEALVALMAGEDAVVRRQVLLDPIGFGGTLGSMDISERRRLEPGVYTLTARAATTTVTATKKNAGAVYTLAFTVYDLPACPADIDGDGVVSAADLQAILSQWGTAGPADINGDGVVNSRDLGQLLGAWGACPL